MRKLNKVDIPAWYPVFNNRLLGFTAKDKNVILQKFFNVNRADKIEMKCLYFRQSLDLLIGVLLRDRMSAEELNGMHLIDKINLVEKYIPDFVSIKKEFHVMRSITNKYIHGNGNRLKEDRSTLFFIMSKIQKWFLSYGENLKYKVRHQDVKQPAEGKSIEKFYLCAAGVIVAVIVVYVGIRFFL
mgnify:CR=1 FL=1